MNIKEELKRLPEEPGVYVMKDSTDNIIYVGKSRNLKSRVSQYFRKSKNRVPKIEELVKFIRSFEYIVTDTELEALILECSLIKKFKPQYNSQMKNDKRYSYIIIDLKETYPGIRVSTEKPEGAEIYGPFNSLSKVETAVDFLKTYFPIKKCNTAIRKISSRCLNYDLNNCLGICCNEIPRDEYMKHIQDVLNFLTGKSVMPVDYIREKMAAAAEELDFESAVKYRDTLMAVEYVINKIKLVKTSEESKNILAVEKFHSGMKLFFIKGNRVMGTLDLDLKNMKAAEAAIEISNQCSSYFKAGQGTLKEISKEDIDEAQIIASYIKSRKNNIAYTVIAKNRNENRLQETRRINSITKLLEKVKLTEENI